MVFYIIINVKAMQNTFNDSQPVKLEEVFSYSFGCYFGDSR